MMLGLKEFGEISPHTSLTVLMVKVHGDPADHLRRGVIPAPLNNVKSCDFSPSPATLWLWWTMFVFLFCFHMSWPALCLSLWLLLTVVFLGATEPSVPRCHFIPIIRFVFLHISEMKRLVVTREACNQHWVHPTVPKLTLCVWVCVRKRNCCCSKERSWEGDSETKVVLGLV